MIRAPLWYVISSYSRGMHYNKSGRATIICKEHHTYLLWSAIMVSVNTIERFFCAHCCPTFSLHRWARDRLFSPHHHWTVYYTLSLITIYSTEEGICSEEQNDGTVPAEESFVSCILNWSQYNMWIFLDKKKYYAIPQSVDWPTIFPTSCPLYEYRT